MSLSLWNSFAERKPGLPGKRDFSGIRLLSVDLNRLTVHSIPSLASSSCCPECSTVHELRFGKYKVCICILTSYL